MQVLFLDQKKTIEIEKQIRNNLRINPSKDIKFNLLNLGDPPKTI